jgi:hypothetical protein
VAKTGFVPATISEAVIAAPNVKEPSAVISGKSNIRKLIKMPSANSPRISPIVIEPINSVIDFFLID